MKYKILKLVYLPVTNSHTYRETELNKFQKEICELYNKDIDEFESKDTAVKAIKMLKLKWPQDLFTIKEFI